MMRRTSAPSTGLILFVAFLTASSPLLHAGDRGRGLNNRAYVEVDIDAEAELENARRLVKEGRLRDAVVQYLQVRRRFPDKLHLYKESDGRYQLFVPIKVFVDQTLLSLPEPGRTFYLQMVNPQAA
ncbi:MAG: hypothetical protein ACYTHN_22040, partial [Planctomycetota bacterium]